MLSICGTDLIACWAYEEQNFRASSASDKMWTFLHVQSMLSTLSIRGINFIACWAYWEPILSHAEHARKCLKVEYLCRIEYEFSKIVLQALGTIRIRFLQKKSKKNSSLCTSSGLPGLRLFNISSELPGPRYSYSPCRDCLDPGIDSHLVRTAWNHV